MSKTAKAIMVTGLVGTMAGLGYVLATRRNGRDEQAEASEPATTTTSGASSEPSAPPVQASTTAPTVASLPGPSAPLAEPVDALAHKRISWSTVDDDGDVIEAPSKLLTQAARFDVHIDFDELTGARLIASEHASATFTEAACIVDTEVNRAERRARTLYRSLTHADTFGKQGRKRPASTRRDPQYRHLLAARAVLSGEARGISRGATRFSIRWPWRRCTGNIGDGSKAGRMAIGPRSSAAMRRPCWKHGASISVAGLLGTDAHRIAANADGIRSHGSGRFPASTPCACS